MVCEKYRLTETDWWLEEIPCLHRLHSTLPLRGAHKIQNKLGMSLSISSLEVKLKLLSEKVQNSNDKNNLNQKALLTFDDGHKDVLLSLPILEKFSNIQPVLFMTGQQLNGETIPLPLTALYFWCEKNNRDPNQLMKDYGFNRTTLKLLPEKRQRELLHNAGIDINPQEEKMMGGNDLSYLIKRNWLIGYHGSHHCDLRIYDGAELESTFKNDLTLLQHMGYVSWLAWPEGRWNDDLYEMANQLGIDMQFGLLNEKGIGTNPQVLNRVIWK